MPKTGFNRQFFFSLLLCLAFTVYAGGDDIDHAAHGVASEKLKSIMQNLDLTVINSNNPDNQPEEIAETDLDDMREAVEELLFHAELLRTDIPRRGMDETKLVTFRAIASQLYTESLNIQQISEHYSSNDQELLYEAYQRLYQTCAACHKLFRDTANKLED